MSALAATLACALAAAPVAAQTAASVARPMRIVIPYAAGSSSDIRGRIIAQAMAVPLGHAVVIDNRPGIAGADMLAKATPDGQTSGFLNATVLATATLLSSSLPFDPDRDYAPVALIANSPEVLVTDTKLNLNSVAELISHVKANPGKLNFGSAGATSLTRLAMELFKAEAGLSILHVPYKGIGLAINDTIGGRVQMLISDLSGVQPFVRSGALKALAVTSARRIPLLPGVPTMAEVGLPNVISDNLTGLVVPSATPGAPIRRLYDAAISALGKPEVVQQLTNQGVIPTPASAAELRTRVRDERQRWAPIIKTHNIRADG